MTIPTIPPVYPMKIENDDSLKANDHKRQSEVDALATNALSTQMSSTVISMSSRAIESEIPASSRSSAPSSSTQRLEQDIILQTSHSSIQAVSSASHKTTSELRAGEDTKTSGSFGSSLNSSPRLSSLMTLATVATARW